jgi:small basic protein (TIGR04137 family)
MNMRQKTHACNIEILSISQSRYRRQKKAKNPAFLTCQISQCLLVSAPRNLQQANFMSKHNSLKASSTVGGKRSVLKRFERVKLMKERGQWKQGRSPIGLPKTKHEG